MASDKGLTRVSVGFYGGQSLSLRLTESAIKGLEKALGKEEWHDLETEDGTLRVKLAHVVYVHVESDDHRVGFGS